MKIYQDSEISILAELSVYYMLELARTVYVSNALHICLMG